MMPREIPKAYEPQEIEERWAKAWFDEKLFRAENSGDGSGRAFSIALPPPNVTGSIHIGHMLEHTQIDMLVRWHRMRGERTLWLPGMDHAGIATQFVVERMLAKEGIKRQDFGREEFERRVWKWKAESGGVIKEQMIRLGASCDWTRERFTLEPALYRAVLEAFLRLYREGLIYRGRYMVNWCPRCLTAISDLEVVHNERVGNLWYIRYPVAGTKEHLIVATTRPETMLGDTAVAVHPDDERYQHLIGKKVLLPLMNREIPIIADASVDREFGTGAVKITPAHDPNDFEMGKRHHLPQIDVMTADAHISEAAGPSAAPAAKCVLDGFIEVVPDNQRTILLGWFENIRDWCISRQLWWGHRIPIWHCADCEEMVPALDSRVEIVEGHARAASVPTKCPKCGSAKLRQDKDVLDTWFSSGLWPFSTLGWPDDTEDLRTYYPTSLLISGYDILFFWDARMMMLGLELTNEVPFRQVHLHTLVRDPERQKMSKTKGNVVDPLDIIDKYGTDAVRLALMMSAAPGTDITYSEDRLNSARQFGNKMWNAARMILMNMEAAGIEPSIPDAGRAEPLEDRWIFSRLNATAESVNRALEQHRYHEVAEELWQFFWHDFCDWYLEIKKLRQTPNSGLTNDWRNFLSVFGAYLRLQHPLMPFITEELWHRFGKTESIALAEYPRAGPRDEGAEREMALMQEMITAARQLRADNGVDKKLLLQGVLYCRNGAKSVDLSVVEKLANVELDIRG